MQVAVIISLFLCTWIRAETAVRPLVTFAPQWNKIFTGDSITMTCDVGSMAQGDLVYNWYKDNDWVHTGKSYTIQQAHHSHCGSYHCQTKNSDRSDTARLDVYSGYVILQAPLHVYEGDNVTLRCNHYPGYATKQTAFYKDGEVIQDWSLESELLIENVDTNSVQKYKCTKQVYHHLLYYRHTDEVTFTAQELFTPPILKLTEGDHMTLTCDTILKPLREKTKLQFAFYKDGQNIKSYSSSGRFPIPSAYLKDSGSYMCQVRTSTNLVEKDSLPLHIEAKQEVTGSQETRPHGNSDSPEIIETQHLGTQHPVTHRPVTEEKNHLVSILPVTLVVVLLVLVIAILAIMYRRKQIWLSVNNQQQITVIDKEDSVESEDTYIVSDMLHTMQTSQMSTKHPPGYTKVPALEMAFE